jgi:DNA-binding transcriptional LysR family regulator
MMKQHGLTQNIALTVSNFIAAAVAVSRTDYVVGMPARTAEALCGMLPLKQLTLELTPKPPPLTMALIWHARTHADPGARAFRQLVIDALRDGSVPTRPPAARPSRRAS